MRSAPEFHEWRGDVLYLAHRILAVLALGAVLGLACFVWQERREQAAAEAWVRSLNLPEET